MCDKWEKENSNSQDTTSSQEEADQEPGDEEIDGGGGGAWRYFVRKMRSNDLPETGRLYRQLLAANPNDQDLLEECIREGMAATERRRQAAMHGERINSFGPSERTAQRSVRRVPPRYGAATSHYRCPDIATGVGRRRQKWERRSRRIMGPML